MKRLRDYGDIMTVKEVQEFLGIGKNAVYDLLRKGFLKHKKVGGKYLIAKSSVKSFINI